MQLGWALLLFALLATTAYNTSRTSRGPEIGGTEKGCFVYQTKDNELNYVTQQAKVETKWHEQWI